MNQEELNLNEFRIKLEKVYPRFYNKDKEIFELIFRKFPTLYKFFSVESFVENFNKADSAGEDVLDYFNRVIKTLSKKRKFINYGAFDEE